VKIAFLSPVWEDDLYWQQTDKSILRKINTLIKKSSVPLLKEAESPNP
jgi:toxin YoeB